MIHLALFYQFAIDYDNVIVCSSHADSGIATDDQNRNSDGADEDAPLITSENSDLQDDEVQQAQIACTTPLSHQTASTQQCVFAFNLAIVCSLFLILLEGLCYDQALNEALELSFYIVRIVYYCVLLAATATGAALVSIKLPSQVSVFVCLFKQTSIFSSK